MDILETIDGPLLLNECVSDPSQCPLGDYYAVHSVWCQAQADLVDRLSRANVAQMVQPQNSSIAPVENLQPSIRTLTYPQE